MAPSDNASKLTASKQFGNIQPKADNEPENSAVAKTSGGRPAAKEGYVTIKEQIRRVDSIPPQATGGDLKKQRFSVEEHQEIRRYGLSPSTILKRSLADLKLPNFKVDPKMEDPKNPTEAIPKQKNSGMARDGQSGLEVTGSLEDKSSGKMFKLYGVLVRT